jgi:ribosomal protein S18 acetylase RimI-like enzyme
MIQYFRELAERFSEGFDSEGALEEAAASYRSPHGLFLLATADDEPAGCGALKFLNESTAELKRMWVSPNCRGLGLGSRLLRSLEAEARFRGYKRMVLDTNGSLTEAISLYKRHGYVEVATYNDNPYAELWFAKMLNDKL